MDCGAGGAHKGPGSFHYDVALGRYFMGFSPYDRTARMRMAQSKLLIESTEMS